ncbi:aminopeptidase N [Actibacterium atlanticum]|uniref:Aminopeptidase N n=1 Tax=Actibacterium atlanticum TaxID=1461693 RepID=A0A058ZPI3_9RHOB|nr:aminopeptidase N [Actibacterium atlanticum]KCV83135.1 aminopeptidase N [Actibacterium atlanticum]
MSDTPQPILLADYTAFGWLIDQVELEFHLAPRATRVLSKISLRPNPDAPAQDFFLHGEELRLIWAKINGERITPEVSKTGLTCAVPDAPFVWEAEVEIDPQDNTALEGLYMSRGMYCTQCEAEGFRKITFYPDRPDVMAPFKVRIFGEDPVLLSNGNPVAQGEWHDPWPKPAYLFALVAGDLRAVSSSFTTASGKDVELNIWVRPGDEDRCDYGLDALKRSMKWDEDVYGREYDLDVFNIVAVDDFNMGAMENKGLNIFNSKCVLASPETATDADFARIEAIIAHEYFHNWTGNRITCRDWFQLCLKEGLTVFRDQQFSGDMRSHAVHRIQDVLMLRGRQFREDNGPLAHPVRPESYVEINNFYTATVYEKGAELIGMLKRLVGDDGYSQALDLYFDRHDGDAATIEDWLKVFEDATGRDLSQFKRWYSQPGTPRLHMSEAFEDGTYTLSFAQDTPPTPGQDVKDPQVIPIAVGLLGANGNEVMPTTVLEMTEAKQSFSFRNSVEGWVLDGPAAAERISGAAPEKPTPSVLRHFSAPVILERDITPETLGFLLSHDTDPFNKWEAGRALAKHVLLTMITQSTQPDALYLDAMAQVAADSALDPAFRALALGLPSQDDIAQALFDSGQTPDPQVIYDAGQSLRDALAAHLEPALAPIYDAMACPGPYSPEAGDAGKRALRHGALGLLSRCDGGARAEALYQAADNMTDQTGALTSLLAIAKGGDQVQAFYDQWHGDRLVLDKWFGMQVSLAKPDQAAQVAHSLAEHPDFDWTNPNRFRALIGGLAMNTAGFHHESGAGYQFVADWLIRLDSKNPQTAARMSTAFETWRRFDADRQDMMREQMQKIAAHDKLSRDMGEMITRMLDAN